MGRTEIALADQMRAAFRDPAAWDETPMPDGSTVFRRSHGHVTVTAWVLSGGQVGGDVQTAVYAQVWGGTPQEAVEHAEAVCGDWGFDSLDARDALTG